MVLLPVISPLHQLELQVEAAIPPRERRPLLSSRFVSLAPSRLDRANSLPFRRRPPALKRSHTTRDVVTLVTVRAGDLALIPLRPLSIASTLTLFSPKPPPLAPLAPGSRPAPALALLLLLLPPLLAPLALLALLALLAPLPGARRALLAPQQPLWARSHSAPLAPTLHSHSSATTATTGTKGSKDTKVTTKRNSVAPRSSHHHQPSLEDTMGDMIPSMQFDRALVYLFDLVSTLGRLLDRLDLDDDGLDHDVLDDFDYAGEIALIMTAPYATTDGAGAIASLAQCQLAMPATTTAAPAPALAPMPRQRPQPRGDTDGAIEEVDEFSSSGVVSESSDDDYDSLYATITHPQVTLLRKSLGLSLSLIQTPPRLAKRQPAPPLKHTPAPPIHSPSTTALPLPAPTIINDYPTPKRPSSTSYGNHGVKHELKRDLKQGLKHPSLAPNRGGMYTYHAATTKSPSLLPTMPQDAYNGSGTTTSPSADKSLAYGIDIPHCVNHDYLAALVRNLALDNGADASGDVPYYTLNPNANPLLDLFRADVGLTKRLAVHRTRTRTTKALVVLKQLPEAPISASTHDVTTAMAPPSAPALQARHSTIAPTNTNGSGNTNQALALLAPSQPSVAFAAPVSSEPVGLQLPFQQQKHGHHQPPSHISSHRRDKKRLPSTSPPHNGSSSKGNTPPHMLTALLIQDMTPEARTKLALQFRNIGKHREALYQLQIAALPPHNFPKAMFLYAMALRFGLGVKQNDRLCIKWLGKCILMFSQPKALADIVDKLNALQPEELVKLIVKKLAYDLQKDPVNNGSDPYQLFNQMSRLSKTDVLKIANTSKNQSDILAVAYFELANAVLNGWGLNHKEEMQGIKLLLKSAAMGYVQAMMQLGEIWATKSKTRKKDLNKAAAWLRLLELFGAKSMGNSWIYKSKYMKRK